MSDMRRHRVKAAYDEKRKRLKYELLMHRPEKKTQATKKKSAQLKRRPAPLPMRW